MKRILLSILGICFLATLAVAQKAKVQTAYNYYKEPYKQFDKAKEAIDEAVANESTSSMPKAWYYRGLIYSSLYQNEKYGALCINCLEIAYESFKKVNELDPKNEWADEINTMRIPWVMNKLFSEGVDQFKDKDYSGALSTFESVQKMSPNDTSAILNSAYSAERAGQPDKAIQYYQKLLGMHYADPKIYLAQANLYKQKGDAEKALETVRNGRNEFPKDLNLMLAEINILLTKGDNAAATKALDDAIAQDPNNQNLYLALGSTYDNLANPKGPDGKDAPKPANATEYFSKAEDAYKKGLAINPDNYELNYNLGALYFNQAAEMANAANDLKSDELYNKAKGKFEEKFKQAQPFLEKALDLNPNKTEEDGQLYQGTLNSLKQLYARIGEMDKYNKIKNLLEKK